MDAESLRGAVLAVYPQGPEAVADLVVKLVEDLAARLTALEADIAALRAENAALRARLNTDSHNSSKPPSSDGPEVKPHPKSQRPQGQRESGAQDGHPGHHLALVDNPDEVQPHVPEHCANCGASLAEAPVVKVERQQEIDLPPIKARVIEHRTETKRCPDCGAETRGESPAELKAPVQYGPNVLTLAVYLNQQQLLPEERTCQTLADLCGLPIAGGTLAAAVEQMYEHLKKPEAAIRESIERAEVAHFDETGINVAAHNHWLHVASTKRLTFYAVHEKRGRAAFEDIGVLKVFRGRAIHDGLASYWSYRQCPHGLCNAHHLRELTFVFEELHQPWAGSLKVLLLEIKGCVDAARASGETALPTAVKADFSTRYDGLLEAGLNLNPPPPPTGKKGRPKRGKAGSLVDRLREHKTETLAFMEDFRVPFDNNQAERDLRMIKTRQKVSGCFRTFKGAQRFCRIRGYISTLRKHAMPILWALGQAIHGHPPLPPGVQATSPG